MGKHHEISIRVFDTILDGRHRSSTDRNYADVWRAFSQLSGWKCYHERLHTLSDVGFFLGRAIREEVVIFSGHGCMIDGLLLSNGEYMTPESVSEYAPKPKTKDKIVILSACDIGESDELCLAYKEAFQAKALFAYKHAMQDRYCFLYDSILLTSIEKYGATKTMFESYQENTLFMKNLNQKGVKKHPMVMY